jgi:hypothetical protein
LAGYGTFEKYTPSQLSAIKALSFDAMFGGLKFEYTPQPSKVMHFSFPIIVGIGMARIDSAKYFYERTPYNGGRNSSNGHRGNEAGFGDFDNSSFFVIQPGVKLETNVFKFAKLFVGANYRLAIGNAASTAKVTPIPKSSQLSGFGVSFGAKVGIFNYDLNKKRNFKLFTS